LLCEKDFCHLYQDDPRVRKELSANFHRLNVLLIRIEQTSLTPVARKVAMATLSEAKIQANFGKNCFYLICGK